MLQRKIKRNKNKNYLFCWLKGFQDRQNNWYKKKRCKESELVDKKKRTGWQKEIIWTTGTSCLKVGEHYAEDKCNQNLLVHQWTVIYQQGHVTHPYCYIIRLANKQNWDHPLNQQQACGVSGKLELFWVLSHCQLIAFLSIFVSKARFYLTSASAFLAYQIWPHGLSNQLIYYKNF